MANAFGKQIFMKIFYNEEVYGFITFDTFLYIQLVL